MIKVAMPNDKVITLNSLNELDLESLVVNCKSYDNGGDGIILAITPVEPQWKNYYENEYGEAVDYTVGYGDYLD